MHFGPNCDISVLVRINNQGQICSEHSTAPAQHHTWHHAVVEGPLLDAEHHLRHLPQPLVGHADGDLQPIRGEDAVT